MSEDLEDQLNDLDRKFGILWRTLIAHDPAFAEKLAAQLETGMDHADSADEMMSYTDFSSKLKSMRKALGQL